MGGTDLTLPSGLAPAVTTMSVATTGAKLETVTFPYYLIIDAASSTWEVVQVTACTSATPQVATVVRGAGFGIGSSLHSAGATVEAYYPNTNAFFRLNRNPVSVFGF